MSVNPDRFFKTKVPDEKQYSKIGTVFENTLSIL
jgi:hypothetical protein